MSTHQMALRTVHGMNRLGWVEGQNLVIASDGTLAAKKMELPQSLLLWADEGVK